MTNGKKKLFDKCVGLLEESGLGENAVCEVTWVFEDVAEGMISLLSRKAYKRHCHTSL